MRKKSLTFAVFFIIVDQIIKLIINNLLSYGGRITIINNFFNLTKIYNEGAAWSLFAGGRILLIAIAILAFLFLLKYQDSFENKKRTLIGFSLIYGGLFGNLIDRIIWGHVIDYLEFIFGNYHFPIFNFADMCLVVGVGLLIIALVRKEDRNEIK